MKGAGSREWARYKPSLYTQLATHGLLNKKEAYAIWTQQKHSPNTSSLPSAALKRLRYLLQKRKGGQWGWAPVVLAFSTVGGIAFNNFASISPPHKLNQLEPEPKKNHLGTRRFLKIGLLISLILSFMYH